MKIAEKYTVLCVGMLLILLLIPAYSYAGDVSGASITLPGSGVVTGRALDGVTIQIRPQSSYSAVAVNDDGTTGQDRLHIYHLGGSSRFYLEAMSDDSYRMFMYRSFENTEHKADGNCIVDISDNDDYEQDGAAVHVVSGNWDASNKQWKLYRQSDGSYCIQNVRSGMFWSLDEPDNINDDNNKVVQSKTAMKWEISIVSPGNKSWASVKPYDSYNITAKETGTDDAVTGMNWMSQLSDLISVSDLSIPGAHDAATCSVSMGRFARCQQLYINDMLRAGVRYLDLRFDIDDNDNIVMKHGSAWCHDGDQEVNLKAEKVMGWIDDFLEENPGETVIIQVKNDGEDSKTPRIYSFLKERFENNSDPYYVGDHVPTLGEVRGKIIVISRLYPEDITGIEDDNTLYNVGRDSQILQWALDAHDWKPGDNYTTQLAASGNNFEVWTQDNYEMFASEKWDWVRKSLTGETSPSTRVHDAFNFGKRAWVINYTSCEYLQDAKTPQDCAREINRWLKTADWMPNAAFLGVVCSDYTDAQLTQMVYRSNFERKGSDGDVTAALLARYKADKAAAQAAKVRLVKIKKEKKKVRLLWKVKKMPSAKVGKTGFQIKYSLKKSFKKKTKSKRINKRAKRALTIKKLKKGRIYYFKVRTFTKVKNNATGKTVTVYGKWSNVKRARIR